MACEPAAALSVSAGSPCPLPPRPLPCQTLRFGAVPPGGRAGKRSRMGVRRFKRLTARVDFKATRVSSPSYSSDGIAPWVPSPAWNTTIETISVAARERRKRWHPCRTWGWLPSSWGEDHPPRDRRPKCLTGSAITLVRLAQFFQIGANPRGRHARVADPSGVECQRDGSDQGQRMKAGMGF